MERLACFFSVRKGRAENGPDASPDALLLKEFQQMLRPVLKVFLHNFGAPGVGGYLAVFERFPCDSENVCDITVLLKALAKYLCTDEASRSSKDNLHLDRVCADGSRIGKRKKDK